MSSNPVRIEIKENAKKRELRLEYTYETKGQKGYYHLVRFMSINPGQSTIDLHWQHESVETYKARGLDTVLNTGYGDFSCAAIIRTAEGDLPYRAIFHIEADRFTYSWQRSDDGTTFHTMGDWTLTREPATVSSPPHS